MRHDKTIHTAIVAMLLASTMVGCYFYEPIQRSVATNADKAKSLQKESGRRVILHSNIGHYVLAQMVVDSVQQSLSGVLFTIPNKDSTYLKDESVFRYRESNSSVLNELHVYAKEDSAKCAGDRIVIPLRDVYRIEAIERDQTTSTIYTVLMGIGIVAGTMLLIFLGSLIGN